MSTKKNKIEANTINGNIYQDTTIIEDPGEYVKNEVNAPDDLKVMLNNIAYPIKLKEFLPEGYQPDIKIFDGKFKIRSKPISKGAALKNPQRIEFTFTFSDDQGKSVSEIFEDAIINNKQIPINILSAKKYIGSAIDPFQDDFQDEIKNGKFCIKPQINESVQKKAKVKIEGCDEIYDILLYPMIPTRKLDFAFSNKFENNDLTISFTYDYEHKLMTFSYAYHPSSWNSLIKYYSFFQNARKGNKLIITLVDEKVDIINSSFEKDLCYIDSKTCELYIKFFENMLEIEKYTQSNYFCDNIEITKNDLIVSEFLSNSIRGVAEEFTWNSLNIVATNCKPINDIEKAEFKLEYKENAEFSLLGNKIFVPVIYTYDFVKFLLCIKNDDKSDEIKMVLIPGESNKAHKIAVFKNNIN